MRVRGVVALFSVPLSVVLFVTCARLPRDQPGQPDIDEALGSISATAFEARLRFLADDLLEGRAPSTRGGELAARYLATELSSLGYTPAGDNGTYFQQVPVLESVTRPESRFRMGSGISLKFSSEIIAFSRRPDSRIDVDGEVVFVGYGIVAPEYGWDDYAGADLTGKVAMIMVNEPPATAASPTRFGGEALTYYGRWTYKLEEAARHGAVAALLIHTPESATYPWQVVQSSWGGAQYAIAPAPGEPVLSVQAWVTDDAARAIARAGGQDIDALRRAAASGGAKTVALGTRFSGTLVGTVRERTTPNVIGVLPGSDPSRGVVVTAHYDHLGMTDAAAAAPGADRIFNGALDNASGVAGTLGVAGALARTGVAPRRSVYVVFTAAEESGLLGSEYFVAHPPLPMSSLAANVNIDEVNVFGPSRDLVLIGAERSSIREVASPIARKQQRVIGLDPDSASGSFFRSDQFPLAKAGVPAVSIGLPAQFVGAGSDAALRARDTFNQRDYHQPSDEVRADWNYEAAVADLRLLGELIWRLAMDEAAPQYNRDDPFARVRQ